MVIWNGWLMGYCRLWKLFLLQTTNPDYFLFFLSFLCPPHRGARVLTRCFGRAQETGYLRQEAKRHTSSLLQTLPPFLLVFVCFTGSTRLRKCSSTSSGYFWQNKKFWLPGYPQHQKRERWTSVILSLAYKFKNLSWRSQIRVEEKIDLFWFAAGVF